jgi:hypothetical protein
VSIMPRDITECRAGDPNLRATCEPVGERHPHLSLDSAHRETRGQPQAQGNRHVGQEEDQVANGNVERKQPHVPTRTKPQPELGRHERGTEEQTATHVCRRAVE